MRKATAIFVVVLNLVLLLLVPLSIHGRNMLYEDGTVRQYTVFDDIKREYAPEEAEEVSLSIGWRRTGRYSHSLRLTVYLDYGKHQYKFYHRSFGNDWVDDLTQVLSRFDRDIVQVGNIEKLDALAKGLSDENYDKLIALFEFYG